MIAKKVAALCRETIGGAVVAPPGAMQEMTDEVAVTRTSLDNYRPYRHRMALTRAVPRASKVSGAARA